MPVKTYSSYERFNRLAQVYDARQPSFLPEDNKIFLHLHAVISLGENKKGKAPLTEHNGASLNQTGRINVSQPTTRIESHTGIRCGCPHGQRCCSAECR